jgi:hypothetical protein
MAIQAFPDQPVPGPPRDYVGYGRHIPKVRWPDNARVAINLVLNYTYCISRRNFFGGKQLRVL